MTPVYSQRSDNYIGLAECYFETGKHRQAFRVCQRCVVTQNLEPPRKCLLLTAAI